MAEAKKLVSVLYSIPQVIIIFKQILCVVLVVVVVDDTCRTIIQTGFESSQFSREYNVFQTGAIGKGPIKGRCTTVPGFNYFYFFGMVILLRLEHLKKAPPPIVSTFSPNESVVSLQQPPKAISPMEVTLCGMVTSSRAKHSSKA